jgi:aminoglycoside 6'-N-acetyltransferase I
MRAQLWQIVESENLTEAHDIVASPVGYLEGWYVIPCHREKGVGAALVETAERWARSRGCIEMASNATLENIVSLQAHGRLGYREVEKLICFLKQL